MKYISLLLTCLFLASCSSDSNSSGSESGNTPTPTPQSLVARAWQMQDENTNYTYRVELQKDGKILAHVSQLKSSPIFVDDKDGKLVQKQDANGFAISHLTLWRETVDSAITPSALSSTKTLGVEFFQSLDLKSITAETEEISSGKKTLKVADIDNPIPKLVLGTFTSSEEQWIFVPYQTPDLALTYKKISAYDYQVSLTYSAEEPTTLLRKVIYSRSDKDNAAKPFSGSLDTFKNFRQVYKDRTRNGYVTEFQAYKKVNGEYIPQSDIFALYLPIFQLEKNSVQWTLNLDPRHGGAYSGSFVLNLPYKLEPYQIPKVYAQAGIVDLNAHVGGSLPFDLNEEYVNENTIAYNFYEAIQGSRIHVYVDLNNTHRYFEPRYTSYEVSEVPYYYLSLSDLKFACKKEGLSYHISWTSPGAFEMKAEFTSVDEKTFNNNYSGKKTEHDFYIPVDMEVSAGDMKIIAGRMKLSYKDIHTGETVKISTEKYDISTLCGFN